MRRAFLRDVDVTMTFDGTYARGAGDPRPLPSVTFTLKNKAQGCSAYRVEPSISDGDGGPKSNGLTRPQSDDDFR